MVFGILPSLLSELKAEDHAPESLFVGRRPSLERDSRMELGSAVTFAGFAAVVAAPISAAMELNLIISFDVVENGC